MTGEPAPLNIELQRVVDKIRDILPIAWNGGRIKKELRALSLHVGDLATRACELERCARDD